VTLVELVDYQCPVCKRAAAEYEAPIRSAETKFAGMFGFVRVDFPLATECNNLGGLRGGPGLHPAACAAAAAIRLARRDGPEREDEVRDWIWSHQDQLTRDFVFDGVRSQFGLDVRSQYNEVLPSIRTDTADGRRLRVSGTPTFFLNGRRLPFLAPATMETAIGLEIELTGRALDGRQR
jgi:protein-disulfide isomerase